MADKMTKEEKAQVKAEKNMNELDTWYNDTMSKTKTDSEKKRIQKEYDSRKQKGKGKPLVWVQGAEEANAKMYENNPHYQKNVDNKIEASKRAGVGMAKNAEGLATGIAVGKALTGDMKGAKDMAKTSTQLKSSQKEMKKDSTNPFKEEDKVEVKNEENSTPKVEEVKDKYEETSYKEEPKEKVSLSDAFEKMGYDVKKSLDDIKANDSYEKEGLDDAKYIEKVGDTQKKNSTDLEKMNEISKKFHEEAYGIDDAYKGNLHKTLWKMYKDGDISKGDLGHFILNGLGTRLVNASQVARGGAPTMESDFQKVNQSLMEGGLERYNKKRDEVMSKTLEQLGMNSEMLNKFNMDVDTLKNNKIFDQATKALDRKGMERTIQAYKTAGNYLGNLTDEQKSDVFMAIMALNSKDGQSAGISYLTSTLGKPLADNIISLFKE